jgi:hypothetical protein
MFECSVTALLPDQPPTISFQAPNDVANLHALVYRISVETHQSEFLVRSRPPAGSDAMPEICSLNGPFPRAHRDGLDKPPQGCRD